MSSYSLSYIKETYNMPFIKRGMRVKVYDGRMGTITAARGNNLYVRIDGLNRRYILHPTWKITYFDKDGSVIAEYQD